MKYQILIFFLVSLWGQAQENLVLNGGFENGTQNRPENWYFPNDMAYQRTSQAHSGRYAAQIYANSGTFFLTQGGKANIIPVDENHQYTASFWCKSNTYSENLEMIISWYNDNNLIKRERLGKTSISLQWKKKEVVLTAPVGANLAGISFYVSRANGYIILDDVSLVYESGGQEQSIVAPTGLSAKEFQREIALKWDKQAGRNLQWEVFVNDQSVGKTATNAYVVSDLELDTQYTIKVRTLRGGQMSDFSNQLPVRTNNMRRTADDLDRVPHLRTLTIDGVCQQTIDLYYNDLASKNAKIDYFVNGKRVFPTNKRLTFPKKGIQTLKIIIEESPEAKWELIYTLNVQ